MVSFALTIRGRFNLVVGPQGLRVYERPAGIRRRDLEPLFSYALWWC